MEIGGFWRDIMTGADLLQEIPPHYWLLEDFYDPDPRKQDKTYAKRGSFLSKVDFDPMEFGIPPANLASTDTAQLLALIVAKRVLQDAAQGQFAEMNRERISVILGVAAGLELVGEMAGRLQRPAWVKALREHGLPEDEVQAICDGISDHSVPWTESTFPGLLGNVVTGRIANRLDLGGTNCTTDAACASSFSALSMAANELYLGDSDLVITGGVDTTNDPFLFLCFCKTPAMSFKNDCRPFSDQADGTMLGEGLGMVALKRLDDAERDGDRIYAVIRGVGSSSDGRSKSVYAPRPEGQARALQRCYDAAGYSAGTVELLEAHGTGTVAGDIAEFKGASGVFGKDRQDDRQWCALGSIKSQLGHTKSAAGVAGLLKVVMALQHKVLPPTIKIDQPDPRLEIEDSPFYLNTRARPWIRDDAHPRRGAVSSFGFGGTNFHVTVEEYLGQGIPAWRRRGAMPGELVALCAADPEALLEQCRALADALLDHEDLLPFLARTTQASFDPTAECRLCLVAEDIEALGQRLAKAIEKLEKKATKGFSLSAGIHYGVGEGYTADQVAFLFSGQGSQYMGMAADLAMAFPEAVESWDRTTSVSMGEGEPDLHEVVFPQPVFADDEQAALSKRLTATQWAQPAIGATSLASLSLLRKLGLEPRWVGGHSFGEVTALHAAGVLGEQEMMQVARRRGELMAEAAKVPGSMTAVVHPLHELKALVDEWKVEGVVIANINSPRQVVLSGTTTGIEEIEQKLEAEGIMATRLPVATAFHSPVVSPSREPFLEFLGQIPFGEAALPVYANSEAAPYPQDEAQKREILAGQIARPVRFSEQVAAMHEAGARVFVEVGPGAVLTGLVSKCLKGSPFMAVNTDKKGQNGVVAWWNAMGKLMAAGIPLDLGILWGPYQEIDDPRERQRPPLAVEVDGVNLGKKYPPEGGAAALPKPNPPRAPEPPVAPAPAPAAATGAVAVGATLQLPPVPTPPQPRTGATSEWVQAYREIQHQTAEIHHSYQQAMAASHQAFLRLAQTTSANLVGRADPGGAHQRLPELQVAASPPPPYPPVARPVTAPQPMQSPPEPAALVAPPHVTLPAAHGVEVRPVESAPNPAQPEAAPGSNGGNGNGAGEGAPITVEDARALLLTVVAEKTGYPEEILALDMDLEADLGIDSIKRVEILSALQERHPALPELDASELPNIQTLGQVLEFMDQMSKGENGGNGAGNGAADDEVSDLSGPDLPMQGSAGGAPVQSDKI